VKRSYRAFILGSVALASPAFAQTAPAPAAAPPPSGTDATTSDDGKSGVPDIVVTAQRRSENLQRVGVAVTAITGDNLVKAGISQPDDLGRLAPALQVQPSAGSSVSIYLRGVGAQAGNAYAENAVSFNFNGI
jgi:iron complex outermembrane receptor protein